MENTQSTTTGEAKLRGACYLCSAHGVVAYQRSHDCPFSSCECATCEVVRVRRAVVATQLKMRREEKKSLDLPFRSYTCNRCRNHGLTVPKKGHKNVCPFDSCPCPMCTLCHSRSILDANFRKNLGVSRKRVAKSVSPSATLDEPMTRRSRVIHSAPPASYVDSPATSSEHSTMTSPESTADIPEMEVIPNPFLFYSNQFSLISSLDQCFVTIPCAFLSENIAPNEDERTRFLLQSLPQSLLSLIGFY